MNDSDADSSELNDVEQEEYTSDEGEAAFSGRQLNYRWVVKFYPKVLKAKRMALKSMHLTTQGVDQQPPLAIGMRVRIKDLVTEKHKILNGKEGIIVERDRLHSDVRFKVRITSKDDDV